MTRTSPSVLIQSAACSGTRHSRLRLRSSSSMRGTAPPCICVTRTATGTLDFDQASVVQLAANCTGEVSHLVEILPPAAVITYIAIIPNWVCCSYVRCERGMCERLPFRSLEAIASATSGRRQRPCINAVAHTMCCCRGSRLLWLWQLWQPQRVCSSAHMHAAAVRRMKAHSGVPLMCH